MCVAIIHGGSANLIERYVLEVSELSGCKVDWHYIGGRGIIKTLEENAYKVRQCIENTKLHIQLHYQDE